MTVDPPLKPRNETDHERLDRQLVELFQGFRIAITGVQVLFGFLLTAPYAAEFDQIDTVGRILFFIALFGATLASLCLCAPVFQHRILFRMDQKAPLINRANRLGICGGVGLALSISAATTLTVGTLTTDWAAGICAAGVMALCAWLWFLQPFRTRVRLIRRTAHGGTAHSGTPGGGTPGGTTLGGGIPRSVAPRGLPPARRPPRTSPDDLSGVD